jgi:hypothetical protein
LRLASRVYAVQILVVGRWWGLLKLLCTLRCSVDTCCVCTSAGCNQQQHTLLYQGYCYATGLLLYVNMPPCRTCSCLYEPCACCCLLLLSGGACCCHRCMHQPAELHAPATNARNKAINEWRRDMAPIALGKLHWPVYSYRAPAAECPQGC